jgi:hypothetical protein
MSTKKALITAGLLVVSSISLVGCASDYGYSTTDNYGYGAESDYDPGNAPYMRTPDLGTNSGECVYDPTYNDNWHDDMLCGDVRPHLLPDDDYITRDEIEAAARRWELGYDDAYEQYVRDYNDYLERQRQFDEEYLAQFDEYGNCLNPRGCAMQRP